MDSISGYIDRVVYNNGDFYILGMTTQDSDPPVAKRMETAKGNLFGLSQIKRDVPIRLLGRWIRHPKYGRQFSIQSWEPWAQDSAGVALFLNLCIPGFTDVALAHAVAGKWGLETFEVLSEPQKILDASLGIETERLSEALLGWAQSAATRRLSTVLKDGGLTSAEIQMAIKRFGVEAAQIITENPYRLMEIPSSNFAKIDAFAMQLGFKPNDPRRIEGAVLWALYEESRQGHLFVRRGDLPKIVPTLIRKNEMLDLRLDSDPEAAFMEVCAKLVGQKAVLLDPEAGLYLPDYHRYERESAQILATMLKPSTLQFDPAPFIEDYERSNQITLSEAQRQVVTSLAHHHVLTLTGLPGTGKTTAVRALVRLLEETRTSFALMAPTGIAAKRMASVTGHPASTIHRALHYDGMSWGYGEFNKFIVDAVIVDEMSMVDQELFFRLLSALREDTMLVLVGDDAQLPSVGPGNVLRELVECPAIPHVRLTQIFRQSAKGAIVLNSHRINRGEMPILVTPEKETEFKFVRLGHEDRITDLVVEMAAKLKARDANFQVLSAKYDGVVGVDNLNERLRDRLNPAGDSPNEWSQGSLRFRLGDRLMVVRNDYNLGVYNGDVGKLIDIDREEKELLVKIFGMGDNGLDLEVSFSYGLAMEKLRLAYAVTVHKSQGSEFDTVILPIVRTQGRMLQRNLLYTAVTRARKKVWLIGEETAIQRAVENNKIIRRNTVLSKAITSQVAASLEREAPNED